MELNVQTLIIATLLVCSLVLILVLAVMIYGFHRYRIIAAKKRWSALIDKHIEEAIVTGDDARLADGMHSLLKKRAFRQLFLKRIVASSGKFSGAARSSIKMLFNKYNLQKEVWWKVRHRRTYIKGSGIRDLSVMEVEASLPEIEKYLNHPFADVYLEAQAAVVSFKGFEGLGFFYDLPHLMSEWQQLKLLGSIHGVPLDKNPHIISWLGSKNSSVVVFTLRLIRKFQLLVYYELLFELLSHPEGEVRKEAVKTIQKLESSGTTRLLTAVYENQPEPVKLEILRALKSIRDQKSLPFLEEQLRKSEVLALQIASAEALLHISGRETLRNTMTATSVSDRMINIIKHVLQEPL